MDKPAGASTVIVADALSLIHPTVRLAGQARRHAHADAGSFAFIRGFNTGIQT